MAARCLMRLHADTAGKHGDMYMRDTSYLLESVTSVGGEARVTGLALTRDGGHWSTISLIRRIQS